MYKWICLEFFLPFKELTAFYAMSSLRSDPGIKRKPMIRLSGEGCLLTGLIQMGMEAATVSVLHWLTWSAHPVINCFSTQGQPLFSC